MDAPDGAGAECPAPAAHGDRGAYAIEMVRSQLDEAEVPEVRHKVALSEVSVEREGLGLKGVLPL
jgi:hypothetical protein